MNKMIKTNFLIFLILIFSMNTGFTKNIILFISDGCGYNTIEATTFYQFGELNKQIYQQFPIQYAMSTFSLDNPEYDSQKAWTDFKYVLNKPTDSAASATAMATGVKTLNGKIGMDANNNILLNAVEYYESLGKSTGVITTVPFAHATPAGFVAHDTSRNEYMQIAKEMITESAIDVIMGCGHPLYDDDSQFATVQNYKWVGGRKIWNDLVRGIAGSDANGDSKPDFWEFIQDRSDFQALMSGSTPDRVIGIPKVRNTLQEGRSGDKKADAFAVPKLETVPSLAEMTRAAINVLDNNQKGFFLMVEGGAVDWAAHGNLSGRMIEEEIDFNQAVEAAIDWLNQNSSWNETTIIVTGDHETGYITGPGSNDTTQAKEGLMSWKPLINNGKGKMPGLQWNTGDHSNSLIPLFAKGEYAEKFKQFAVKTDPVRGPYIDNSNIGMVLLSLTD